MAAREHLHGCAVCGQVQRVPEQGRWRCCRCDHRLHRIAPDARRRTAALASAGLLLYPIAITLPVMTIERFGRTHSAGVFDGAMSLLRHGDLLVGLAVLIASVILPLVKLLLLLVLDLGAGRLRPHHRGWAWRLVELTGRWGMLDVLLVAVVAALLKLGDVVNVTPGPGALAFTLLVAVSLLAAATFDPRALWHAGDGPAQRGGAAA